MASSQRAAFRAGLGELWPNLLLLGVLAGVLGITCETVWDGAISSVSFVWKWAVHAGLVLGIGYLVALLGSTLIGWAILGAQRRRENKLRAEALEHFVIQMSCEGVGSSLEGSALQRVVGSVASRAIPSLVGDVDHRRVRRMVARSCDRIRRDRAMVALYLAARSTYLLGALPALSESVSRVIKREESSPWRLLMAISTLPLRVFGVEVEWDGIRPVVRQEDLEASYAEWSRVVELGLLANVPLMMQVAESSPALRAAEKSKHTGRPAIEVPLVNSALPEEALLRARKAVEGSGAQWSQPSLLLRQVEQLAVQHAGQAPEVSAALLRDVKRWKARHAMFPKEVYNQLILTDTSAEQWPAWFAKAVAASVAEHGVNSGGVQLLRTCVRLFVLGDDEPEGLRPAASENVVSPSEFEEPELQILPGEDSGDSGSAVEEMF